MWAGLGSGHQRSLDERDVADWPRLLRTGPPVRYLPRHDHLTRGRHALASPQTRKPATKVDSRSQLMEAAGRPSPPIEEQEPCHPSPYDGGTASRGLGRIAPGQVPSGESRRADEARRLSVTDDGRSGPIWVELATRVSPGHARENQGTKHATTTCWGCWRRGFGVASGCSSSR